MDQGVGGNDRTWQLPRDLGWRSNYPKLMLLFVGEGREETGDGEMEGRDEHNDTILRHPALGSVNLPREETPLIHNLALTMKRIYLIPKIKKGRHDYIF